MKLIATTFVLLFAGIYALPQDKALADGGQERIVSNIQKILEEIARHIIDPLEIPDFSKEIVTPIGRAEAWIKDLVCWGLSRKRIDGLSWNPATSRLRFDVVWSSIGCETKTMGVEANILGKQFSAMKSGSVVVSRLRLQGDLRLGFVPGVGGVNIILRDCNVIVTADITSDLIVKKQGQDLSNKYNNKIESLNKWLRDNKDAISATVCDAIRKGL